MKKNKYKQLDQIKKLKKLNEKLGRQSKIIDSKYKTIMKKKRQLDQIKTLKKLNRDSEKKVEND